MSDRHWLFKSEPETYSFADLIAERERVTFWDGVRNYQARNLLRDAILVGSKGFFYHSRISPPAIVGVVEVVGAGRPDPTQFDPGSKYFDPKSKVEAPRWFGVDLRAVGRLRRPVSLPELKAAPELAGIMVAQKGSRLSVQPVSAAHFDWIQQQGDVELLD